MHIVMSIYEYQRTKGRRMMPLKIVKETHSIGRAMSFDEQLKGLKTLIKKPPQNSVILEITPQIAEHVLTHLNVNNRPRKTTKIIRYATDMQNDAWVLTGETIKFGTDGNLKDGQNRMAACMRSGAPFTTHVVFGIDPATFAMMDVGAPRSDSDIIAIMGVLNAKNVSATLRFLMSWEAGKTDTGGGGRTPEDVKNYYLGKIDHDLMQSAVKAAQSVYKTTGLNLPICAAVYYKAHENGDGKAVDKFFEDVKANIGRGAKHPVKGLLNTMTKWKMDFSFKVTHIHQAVLITRAWNAYKNGRKLDNADLVVLLTDKIAEI